MDIKGKEKEFGIDYNTKNFQDYIYLFPQESHDKSNIVIADIKDALFNDCFKNSYIYEFNVQLPNEYSRWRTELIKKKLDGLSDEKYKIESEKFVVESWLCTQQSKYNFINNYLNISEFVEIYTAWHDHENFDFAPPISEYAMNLEELLNVPMPTKTSLYWKDRHKVTIYKI